MSFFDANATTIEKEQRRRTTKASAWNAKIKKSRPLQKERTLLRKEQTETGEIDLFFVGFDLCKICVKCQIGDQLRGHPVLEI